jgi:hypothetical protein
MKRIRVSIVNMTEPGGSKVTVENVEGYTTCSPFFAIHRPYRGHGVWGTDSWKVTHLPSGGIVTPPSRRFSGKNARQILRVIVATLVAYPVDWSSPNPTNLSAIPDIVLTWISRR